VALVDLLASWNIYPQTVVGHSSGEIAAAYCAGRISRQGAWKIAFYRGHVSMKQLGKNGAMMAIGLPENEVPSLIETVNRDLRGSLKVGCFNSPKNLTLTGKRDEILYAKEKLEKDSVFSRVLPVDVAYHSIHMEDVAEEYESLLGDLTFGDKAPVTGKVTMVSSVTGFPISEGQVEQPSYWVQNLVSSVLFSRALLQSVLPDYMAGSSSTKSTELLDTIIEVGPHSALRSAIKETLTENPQLQGVQYCNVLTRKETSATTILQSLGQLVCQGYPVNIASLSNTPSPISLRKPAMLSDLPPYAFDHSKRSRATTRLIEKVKFPEYPRHELLGIPIPDCNDSERRWRNFIRTSEVPWIMDNKVCNFPQLCQGHIDDRTQLNGSFLFPGVAYLVTAIEGAKQFVGRDYDLTGLRLRDLSMKTPLIIPDTKDGIEIMLSMTPHGASEKDLYSWLSFRITSYNVSQSTWSEHCTGFIRVETELPLNPLDTERQNTHGASSTTLPVQESDCTEQFDTDQIYRNFKASGMEFGPSFKNIRELRLTTNRRACIGVVTAADVTDTSPNEDARPRFVHPCTMESMLNVLSVICKADDAPPGSFMLTRHIEEVWISISNDIRPHTSYRVLAATKRHSSNVWRSNVTALDRITEEERILVKGIDLVIIPPASEVSIETVPYYNIQWQPDVSFLISMEKVRDKISPDTPDEIPILPHKEFQLASAIYILDCLESLRKIKISDMLPYHRLFVGWMEHQAELLAANQAPFITPSQVEEIRGDAHQRGRLLKYVEKFSTRGELLVRIGENLIPILKQDRNCLELMFGEDQLMTKAYDELIPGQIRPQLARYLEYLAHNKTNIKILEVGAGTGSATRTFLESLCPRTDQDTPGSPSSLSEYHFTDISAGFLDRARQRFSKWSDLVQFKLLNIELDPEAQGFQPGSYDLVVATHVSSQEVPLRYRTENGLFY
jgi:hypothetical protein